MPPRTIDPLESPKTALSGRIVCMDETFRVIRQGTVYLEKGCIVAVEPKGGPVPSGFEEVPALETGGTLFPGLIELHNHLSYNILRLWAVPKKYTNRDRWAGTAEYRRLISGPMKVIGKTPGLMPAVVRYVECKCLLGGVTTSQGIELYSNVGARRYYRGIVRNVEQTDEADLPEAATKIADVEAADVERFYQRLLRQRCFLLHLSEGIDEAAHRHFLALQREDGSWAITKALAGIHCAALKRPDFSVMAANGGAMVWSPFSNLVLYGKTADMKAVKAEGVRIGIGSDWSPSGSKNLLGELKVARVVSEALGGVFTDREIVAMATRNAAGILGWENFLGSLERGKRADILVISGKTGDPYEKLLKAKETDIRLVMVNGVPRYGFPALMRKLGGEGESLRVGGRSRTIFLEQRTADPAVQPISLKSAREALVEALGDLRALALDLERRPPPPPLRLLSRPEEVVWSLALDEIEETGFELRPRIRMGEAETGPRRAPVDERASIPLSELLEPLKLDPLTVADDDDLLDRIAAEQNLPAYVAPGLRRLYE